MFSVSPFCFHVSSLKDIRQRHIVVDPKLLKKKKYYKFLYNLEPFLKLDYHTPFDTFALFSGLTLFRVFFSTSSNSDYLQISIGPLFYYWYYLSLRMNYEKVYFLLDMYCFAKNNDLYTVNVNSDYLTGSKTIIHTTFDKRVAIPSLSGIYPAYTWVEREASEFFSISFEGLLDTRRLLTDYLSVINDLDQYKTIQYSTLNQNIISI